MSLSCKNCRESLADDAIFCYKCGEKVTPPSCPKCQCTLPEGAQFCAFCGCTISDTQDVNKEETPADSTTEETNIPPTSPVKPKRRWSTAVLAIVLVLDALAIASVVGTVMTIPSKYITIQPDGYITTDVLSYDDWQNGKIPSITTWFNGYDGT